MSIQNQFACQNTPCVDDDINQGIEAAENSRGSLQRLTLLDGIVLKAEVEVFPGVRLVPFPPSLGKKGSEIPRYVSEAASTVGIRSFFYKTQVIIDSPKSSAFNCGQFCQALSLACNSAVQITPLLSVRKDDGPFSLVPYAGPTVTHLPREATKDCDIKEAKRLYKLLGKLSLGVQQRLHIPINRWIKSHVERSIMGIVLEIPLTDIATSPTTRDVDKMIDLGIALESLYLSGRKKLSLKFRKRASWFLKKNEVHRRALKEKFEKVYNLRCDAVHEGKLPRDVEICGKSVPISEFIKQAQILCQQSILKIIKNRQFPDWAKIHIPDR